MTVVVFDFDGVLIPSEDIKKQGYTWIFTEYGEDAPEDAIRESIEEFAGAKGDRYDIIRGILLRVGVRGDIEQKVAEYAGRFTAIVGAKIAEFRVQSDIVSRLAALGKKGPLYINSNTPDGPLQDALAALGIAAHFKGVYGSSVSKTDSLRAIAADEKVGPRDVIFIGDGDGDRSAAEDFGCRFIGISTPSNGWTPATKPFPVVSSVVAIDDAMLAAVI